jgi:Na+/proline symporter
MSCTSAISSVLIGTSTVLSYDVYKTSVLLFPLVVPLKYTQTNILAGFKPNATDSQVLRAGHWCVAGFAIFMAAFAKMLHGVNINLGFIYVSSRTPH